MRAVLWVGGIILFGVVIIIIIPQVTVQNAGSATLVQVNTSNVLGTASLVPTQGNQTTVVTVQVQHLLASSNYALSIHSGSCYGILLTALQPAMTDVNGNGTSTTTLSAQMESSWFIVLHNGSSTRNDVLACGQVTINTVITPQTPTPYEPPFITTPSIPGQFPNTGGGPPQP